MDLMRKADSESVVVRRMYALPFDHRFTHTQQSRLVTAVGDAAHVTNGNGEGVNRAMQDAAEVALALAYLLSPTRINSTSPISSPPLIEQLASAIDECEQGMFARWREQLADDPFNFDLFFSEGGAVKFAEMLRAAMDGGRPDCEPASRDVSKMAPLD